MFGIAAEQFVAGGRQFHASALCLELFIHYSRYFDIL